MGNKCLVCSAAWESGVVWCSPGGGGGGQGRLHCVGTVARLLGRGG